MQGVDYFKIPKQKRGKFLSTSQFACAKDFMSTSLVVKGTSIVYYKKMCEHN